MLFDKETVTLLKNSIRKYGYLDLPAEGTSMFPYIQEGNHCRFCECVPSHLKKGEIALFYAESGQLTAHRFFESKIVGEESYFIFKGDTNLGFDQPVRKDQIIGKLLYVQKRKSMLYVSDVRSQLWGKLVFLVPVLSSIIRRYVNRKSHALY